MHIKSVNVGVHQRMRDAYGDNGLTVDYIGSAQVRGLRKSFRSLKKK